jgi:hypothetical protein
MFVGFEKTLSVLSCIICNNLSVQTSLTSRIRTLRVTVKILWVLKVRVACKRLTFVIKSCRVAKLCLIYIKISRDSLTHTVGWASNISPLFIILDNTIKKFIVFNIFFIVIILSNSIKHCYLVGLSPCLQWIISIKLIRLLSPRKNLFERIYLIAFFNGSIFKPFGYIWKL